MKVAIIQSSLRKESHTSIVCRKTEEVLKSKWVEVNYIDLRDLELEFCDWRDLSEYNSDMQSSYKTCDEADVVLYGMPVYNYTMSWVLKNFIDITAHALKGKRIWVLNNAGSPLCYMASKDLFDALYYEVGTH